MNIKEHIRSFARELSDTFKGIDSDPEHIAVFPAHIAGCSRTKPLVLNTEFIPLPSFYSPNWRIELKSISCSECGGIQTF